MKRNEFLTTLLLILNENDISYEYDIYENIYGEYIYHCEIDYSIFIRATKNKCNITIDDITVYDLDFDNALYQITNELYSECKILSNK